MTALHLPALPAGERVGVRGRRRATRRKHPICCAGPLTPSLSPRGEGVERGEGAEQAAA